MLYIYIHTYKHIEATFITMRLWCMFLRNVEASKSEKVLLTTHYVGPQNQQFVVHWPAPAALRLAGFVGPKP